MKFESFSRRYLVPKPSSQNDSDFKEMTFRAGRVQSK